VQLLTVDDPAAVGAVVAALRAGDAVVVPTETVYGLAALPDHQERLLDLKGRPESVPIAVLVADLDQAAAATGQPLPPMAGQLAAAFWPGPLTLVVPTAAGTTLGIRCPDHDFVRRVAAEVGPIATTSANRHGKPTPPTAAAAAASLAGPVAVVVDGGELAGQASTVVDATGGELGILREGPIGGDELRRVLR
jgi:tRNA threonylcarbamoyl adenosine modification protein (Sua5/YciO/YrdC/YwlC family)